MHALIVANADAIWIYNVALKNTPPLISSFPHREISSRTRGTNYLDAQDNEFVESLYTSIVLLNLIRHIGRVRNKQYHQIVC